MQEPNCRRYPERWCIFCEIYGGVGCAENRPPPVNEDEPKKPVQPNLFTNDEPIPE